MRRRERADVVAGVPIDTLEHRYARALTVGAGDRNHLVGRLAQAERLEHGDEPVEPQVDALWMDGLEPGEPMIERQSALRSCHAKRAPRLRTAPALRTASRAEPRSGRASGGDRGSCRWRPSRA